MLPNPVWVFFDGGFSGQCQFEKREGIHKSYVVKHLFLLPEMPLFWKSRLESGSKASVKLTSADKRAKGDVRAIWQLVSLIILLQSTVNR